MADRDKLIATLLKELPELLADYEHLAKDADGNVDQYRRKRIERIGALRLQIEFGIGMAPRRRRPISNERA